MENTRDIYKTNPNYIFMIFMLFGAGFFTFFITLAWPGKTGETTGFILPILFGLFAILCLSQAVGFKIIYLTATGIIITIPIIFYKRTLLLSEIKSLNDKKVMVDMDPKSFTPDLTQVGNKVIVIMKDGKQIQLSSLQIGRFSEFRKNLHLALVSQGRNAH